MIIIIYCNIFNGLEIQVYNLRRKKFKTFNCNSKTKQNKPGQEHLQLFRTFFIHKESCHTVYGVQRRMISVDNFFRIFEIIIFCFVVAI